MALKCLRLSKTHLKLTAGGNTFWADAIAKEMKDIRVAYGQSAPIGYQKIPSHMIFDIKMEDFRHKARLVAGGHRTKAPATITYASIVSCETVHIAHLMAALNDLEVKIGDVLNAYTTAPVTKKVWTVLGPEIGSNVGKSAVIVRALYGLKSAGAAFHVHLEDTGLGVKKGGFLSPPQNIVFEEKS